MPERRANHHSAPPTTLAKGDLLDERYRVEAVLAVEDGGISCQATRLDGAREAIAVEAVLADGDGLPERFARDALAATSLQGGHVARVVAVRTAAPGVRYVATELPSGERLDAVARARRPPRIEQAVELAAQACAAVAGVQAAGIAARVPRSRDFVVTHAGAHAHAVLVELGLSRPRARPGGEVAGLGAILYELLTGTALGPNPRAPSSWRREVPSALDAIVWRAITPNDAERFPTAVDLAFALAPFRPASPRPSSPPKPVSAPVVTDAGSRVQRRVCASAAGGRWRPRASAAIAVAAVTLVALSIGAYAAVARRAPATPPSAPATHAEPAR